MPARREGERARPSILPAAWTLPRPSLEAFVPSARSVTLGLALAALAAALYAGARVTPVFALREVDVRGVRGADAARVRAALEPLLGTSLLALHADEIDRRVAELPAVASTSYDRDFPHTLRLYVHPEQPVAVLRRGSESWLVSARGRVIRALAPRTFADLARIWAPAATEAHVGDTLPADGGATAAGVLAAVRGARFPSAVRATAAAGPELTLVLRNGVELRLGDSGDLRLKLAIARRALPYVGLPGSVSGVAYLDVSVPQRPVSGIEQPSSRK